MKTNRSKTPVKFFTIAQIAEFMESSERTVRRWIGNGWLIAHRINGLVRISQTDFQTFLASPLLSAAVIPRPRVARRRSPEKGRIP